MAFNFVGDIRFEKAFSGPSLSAFEVTKSSAHCPGQIFTPDTDYKTIAYATYAVDDPDAPRVIKSAKPTYLDSNAISIVKSTTLALDGPTLKSKEQKFTSFRTPYKRAKDIKVINRSDKAITARLPVDSQPKTAALRGSCLKSMKPAAQVPQTESFVPPEFNSKWSSSSGEKKYKNTTTGEHPSMTSSELSSLPPAHQIHNRMMGWKLTSPERRKELLSLLEHAQLSASTVEEDRPDNIEAITTRRPDTAGYGNLHETQRIVQRQAEAMQVSIGRLAHSQRKNIRANREAFERRQQKVKAKENGAKSSSDLRSDLRHRPISPGRVVDPDPFATLLKNRETSSAATASLGRRAVMEFKMRQALERTARESLEGGGASLSSDWDFARPDEPVQKSVNCLPAFQAVQRSPRSLLTPADRMEILENAKSLEKLQRSADTEFYIPPTSPEARPVGLLYQNHQELGERQMVNSLSVPEPYLRRVLNSRGQEKSSL